MKVLRLNLREQFFEGVLVLPWPKQQPAVNARHFELDAFREIEFLGEDARDTDGETIAPFANLCVHDFSHVYTKYITPRGQGNIISRAAVETDRCVQSQSPASRSDTRSSPSPR